MTCHGTNENCMYESVKVLFENYQLGLVMNLVHFRYLLVWPRIYGIWGYKYDQNVILEWSGDGWGHVQASTSNGLTQDKQHRALKVKSTLIVIDIDKVRKEMPTNG